MTMVGDEVRTAGRDDRAASGSRGVDIHYTTGATAERWLDLQRRVGIARPAEAPVETRIQATAHVVSCQWTVPRPDEPDLALTVRARGPATLTDRRTKRFTTLQGLREPEPWTAEPTGRRRASPFGSAEEYRLMPPAGGGTSHLSLWLLAGRQEGKWLRPLWRITLPPLAASGLPDGVPLELRLESAGDGNVDAVMRLDRLQPASFDPRAFTPGRGYREGFDGRAVPAPPATAGEAASVAGVARGGGRQPAIVFQSQTLQEKAKLLVHSSLIDNVVDTAGFVTSLLDEVSGTGLSIDLSDIYDQIGRNAPSPTGAGPADRVAPNVMNRVLLGLLFAKLDLLLDPPELRQAMNDALAAARTPGGNVSAVALPPNVDPEGDSAAAFALMQRYIVNLATTIATPVDALAVLEELWGGGAPDEHTAFVRIVQLLANMTAARQRAMEGWFDVNFGSVMLEPEPRLRQMNGRNEGWSGARYVQDAVALLLDLEFEVGSSAIDFGRQPLVGPVALVTAANDTVIAALDFLDSVRGRPRSRVGLRTALRIRQFSVGATASTNPTTRSPFVVELALVCPPCIPLLWQNAAGTVTLDDITVGVVFAIANDPLGAEDPRLELHVGTPVAAATDFSALTFGGLATYPILSAAVNALANLIGNAVLPGLLASLTRPLASSLRIPEDTFARLQPLLGLDRESYRRRLQAVINGAPDEFLDPATAQMRLDELVNHTPAGQNRVAFRSEFIAYGLSLAIAEPGPGGALVYPPDPEARLPGDMTLLLSHATLQYFLAWAGYGVGYQGDIRLATPQPELSDRPVVDFWNDAPDPGALGPKPNYRTGPPQVTMLPGSTLADWIGYFGIARVSNGLCRILPVSNPPPDAPIAELCVTVEFDVGAITFTPITYEMCEDLTRIADWLDQGFGPPITPLDPADPVPPWAEGIVRVRRTGPTQLGDVGPAISPAVLDALSKAVEDPRLPGNPGLPAGVIASPARGIGGLQGNIGRFGHTVACTLVTSWDKTGMENWLQARLTVTVPVLFGMGGLFLDEPRFLPPLSFRIDPSRATVGELVASAPEGPLAGLLQGANRTWLRDLMANHAIALLNSDRAAYRTGHPQMRGLNYAYGPSPSLALQPEGFLARAFMTLNRTFWSADPVANPGEGDVPPLITVETFGGNPDRLNLAVNFNVLTNVLDRIRMG
jgi:hypothetical protein